MLFRSKLQPAATIVATVDGFFSRRGRHTSIAIKTRAAGAAATAERIVVRASGVTEFKENIEFDTSKGIKFAASATPQTIPYVSLTGTVTTTATTIGVAAFKTYNVTVTGAALGDVAIASCSFSIGSTDTTALKLMAAVTGANQVTVILENPYTTPFSVPNGGTIKARVIK